ncbi:MAG: DUF4162 domain-containing protein, partial [Acidobacteriota bacterium]
LIHRGSSVLSGSLGEIKAAYGRNTIAVEYEGQQGGLESIQGVRSVQDTGRLARLLMEPGADSQEILRQVIDRVTIRSFRLEVPHIEEIYIEKVGADRKEEKA